MKKIFSILVVMLLLMVGCSRVPSGYTGLKVNLLGSEKGDIKELTAGRYWVGVNEELHLFPTFNLNYVWTANKDEGSPNDESFSFAIEGMNIGIDVGIEYFLEKGRIKDIFVTYRKGVQELTDITIRNRVRDGFTNFSKNYTMNDMVDGKISDLVENVETSLRTEFENQGINIKSLSLVNAPRYPRTVIESIEAKITATQDAIKAENQLREATAQAKKKIAEATGRAESAMIEARAEAEANRLKAKSYSQAVLTAMWIDKWDGSVPTVSSDSGLMLQMPK